MEEYSVKELPLKGAYLIDEGYSVDKRGSFTKIFEKDLYNRCGIDMKIDETFISISKKNVIRGLHFQMRNPQAKLVSVCVGKVWDVIVDLRLDSSTYSQWIGVELSATNHKALYIPKGFAHGFLALEDMVVMLYQCEGRYDKETDTGIVFDDKDIAISWPIDDDRIILSERDMQLMTLKQYESIVLKQMKDNYLYKSIEEKVYDI